MVVTSTARQPHGAVRQAAYEPTPDAHLDELVDPASLDLSAVLQALGDPVRRAIVMQLADVEERSCSSVDVPVTKSTCSHHFRVLREAGVISTRTDGKTRLNRLERGALEQRFPGLLSAILAAGAS